jgi:hypothetical protein
MNPGDIRTFKRGTGNAVVVAVGVWAERPKGNAPIHIHLTGIGGKHTTVTNDAKSERYHRTLFRDLRHLLIGQKCWPYGDEGAETEIRS